MTDLAAPTAKKTPDPTPVVVVQTTQVDTTPQPRPVSSITPSPVFREPSPPPQQNTSSSGSNNTVDDLEALMESLNVASNNRGSRRPATQKQAEPVVAKEPPKPASASFNANTNYTPTPASAPPPKATPASATFNSSPVTPQPQNNAPIKGDDLDKLLSNLTSQMDHIEPDNPASRGQCATCKGAILGEMMQALGRCYHPEHFACGNCQQPLGTRNFFEQNGLPHCADCYQTMYCPKCAHCNAAILDRCITALGKKWHPEHFICAQCLQPLPRWKFL